MSQVQGGGVSTLRDREFPPCSFHCSLSPLFELQTGQKGLSFFRRQYSSKLRYTLHANARAAAGDLVARDGAPTHFGFNPRPRATGDDSRPVAPDVPERVSIHARAWRATSTVTSCSTSYSSFNPRPRAAGDQFPLLVVLAELVSIHARARRATKAGAYPVRHPVFQSTPARGGRQVCLAYSVCR